MEIETKAKAGDAKAQTKLIVPPDTPDGIVERVISMIEECGLSVQSDDHEV